MNPSELLSGRYRLIEPLGEGRIGTVWLAHDRKAAVDVAIKIPHSWQGRNPEFVARFRRELLTGMRLHHPAIVRSLDTGQHEGMPFLVMELVQGAPAPIWFESTRRDFDALAQLLTQLLDALSYAHNHRLVHQDLKPANILVDVQNQVHITDFGLAGRLEDQTAVSETGEMLADLAYLSPEQAMGERGDVRSDLYSLGAVLYHILTGRPPVEARDPAQFLLAILNQSPQPPHRVRQDIPSWLARLTMRMMARQPEDRPATASEVQRVLQRQTARQSEPSPAGKRRSLLGRDEPLAELRGYLAELKNGNGALVRVTGTAGIGKTSLVDEFLRRSRPIAGVKIEATGLQTLHPGVLEKALGGSGTLLDRVGQRLAQGPLILVVDGFHEATPALAECLRDLAARQLALLIVLTERPGGKGRPEWLGEVPHRILLRGFPRDVCARYVEESLWAAPPDAAVGWLMKMTHGNPLHLGLLLRQLEGTYLQLSGVVATWEEPRDVPRTLPDLISWIIERQGPEGTSVISMAACLEERFELGLLQSVVTYEERVLEDTLDGLVRAGLLEERWENGVQQYCFAHEPIWRVALHRVPERRQRRLCLLTGNLTAGIDPERAARFFMRAQSPAPAVEQLLLLAAREFQEGFFETTVFLTGRAEKLAEEAGLEARQTEALLLRARALAGAGHFQPARESAHRVLKRQPSAEQATEARSLLRRTPIESRKQTLVVKPPAPPRRRAGNSPAQRPPAPLAPELALSPAAKRAVLGARKKGVAPPAPPARQPKKSVAPPAKKEVASVKPPARKSPVAPPKPAGEPLFGIKPPKQGVTMDAEEYPGLLGLVKPPKAAPGSSSEEPRAVAGPQGRVGPAGRVKPPRSSLTQGYLATRSRTPAPSPVVHPTDQLEPEGPLAPGRLAGPVTAEVTPPPPAPATPPEPEAVAPAPDPVPPPDRVLPQFSEAVQEPPAPPPDQTPEHLEPPEMAARRRYETARAAGDREAAARAAEELARHFEGTRERQKANLWRHQARILNS